MYFEEQYSIAMLLYSIDRDLNCRCNEDQTCEQCLDELAIDVAIDSAKSKKEDI